MPIARARASPGHNRAARPAAARRGPPSLHSGSRRDSSRRHCPGRPASTRTVPVHAARRPRHERGHRRGHGKQRRLVVGTGLARAGASSEARRGFADAGVALDQEHRLRRSRQRCASALAIAGDEAEWREASKGAAVARSAVAWLRRVRRARRCARRGAAVCGSGSRWSPRRSCSARQPGRTGARAVPRGRRAHRAGASGPRQVSSRSGSAFKQAFVRGRGPRRGRRPIRTPRRHARAAPPRCRHALRGPARGGAAATRRSGGAASISPSRLSRGWRADRLPRRRRDPGERCPLERRDRSVSAHARGLGHARRRRRSPRRSPAARSRCRARRRLRRPVGPSSFRARAEAGEAVPRGVRPSIATSYGRASASASCAPVIRPCQ